MNQPTVLFEVHNHTAIATLNRPHRMNAVIEAMYDELFHIMKRVQEDPTIRALILTGSPRVKHGERKEVFCAGADLKEHGAGTRTPAQKKAYIELAHRCCLALRTLPVPTIAAVGGPARGAGAELALNCDFILMADDATLAFPETGLGTMVGGGATRHLERIVGHVQAKALIFTGRVVQGWEAVEMGLALESVPAIRLMDDARELAQKMVTKAPVSMTLAKKLLEQAPEKSLARIYDDETEAIVACMKSRDWQEGIDAFREKRAPRFKGE